MELAGGKEQLRRLEGEETDMAEGMELAGERGGGSWQEGRSNVVGWSNGTSWKEKVMELAGGKE